jgi:hypothetical protein
LVLYQGTTSVGPHRIKEGWASAPARAYPSDYFVREDSGEKPRGERVCVRTHGLQNESRRDG